MNETVEPKGKRERSPNFPSISLRTAIDRLRQFEAKFGRHEAQANNAGIAWGLKPKSSSAFQVIAALSSYGLLNHSGVGENRRVSLSDLARRYLRAQQQTIKTEALREAALTAKPISDRWDEWGPGARPPKEVCLDDLVLKHRFTEEAAKRFLRIYDDTIEFAGLAEADSPIDDDEDKGETGQEGSGGSTDDFLERTTRDFFGPPGQMDPPYGIGGRKQDKEPRPKEARWHEERLIDDDGREIVVAFSGKPSTRSYEYLRDYFAFKIERIQVRPSSTSTDDSQGSVDGPDDEQPGEPNPFS